MNNIYWADTRNEKSTLVEYLTRRFTVVSYFSTRHLHVIALAVIITCTVACGHAPLTQTSSLDSSETLYVQRHQNLSYYDLSIPEFRPSVAVEIEGRTIPNNELAVLPGGGVLVTTGLEILEVSAEGRKDVWRRLRVDELNCSENEAEDEAFFVGPSEFRKSSSSYVSTLRNGDTTCVCEIASQQSSRPSCMEVPSWASVAISGTRDLVISSEPDGNLKLMDIDGTSQTTIQHDEVLRNLELNPSETRVLGMSGRGLKRNVIVVGLSSEERFELPIRAFAAAWLDNTRILVVECENTLGLFDTESMEYSVLLQVGEALPLQSDNESISIHTEAPIVSRHGRYVSWDWRASVDGNEKKGTALIDMKREEYRLVDRRAMNVGWCDRD